MTGHTPGPWTVEEGHIQRDSGGIRYWQITDGQDAIACNQFCYAGFDPERNTANSHLISAAPELLEAADLLESLCAWMLHRFGPGTPEAKEAEFRAQMARAAIAKAKGETT